MGAAVVRELRAAGHDAVHLEELGQRTLPDLDIFHMARETDRVILTFDLDFTDIAAATRATFPSVIVFRLRYGRSIRGSCTSQSSSGLGIRSTRTRCFDCR